MAGLSTATRLPLSVSPVIVVQVTSQPMGKLRVNSTPPSELVRRAIAKEFKLMHTTSELGLVRMRTRFTKIQK